MAVEPIDIKKNKKPIDTAAEPIEKKKKKKKKTIEPTISRSSYCDRPGRSHQYKADPPTVVATIEPTISRSSYCDRQGRNNKADPSTEIAHNCINSNKPPVSPLVHKKQPYQPLSNKERGKYLAADQLEDKEEN